MVEDMDGVKEGELTYDTRVLGVTGVCVPLLTGRGDGEWGEPGVLGPLGRANLRSWPLFIVQRRRGQKDCRHPAGCSVTYKGTRVTCYASVTRQVIITESHLSSSPPSVLTLPASSTQNFNHTLAKQTPNAVPAATWRQV